MATKLKRAFAVIVGFVLLMYSIICSTYMLRGYTRLIGFYALEKNSVDVVFVGTSVTFSSFMPMEAWHDYGIVAYNYCTNVQFENALRYSLKDIERTQKPKIIMLDVAPFLYAHYAGNEGWDKKDLELYIKYNLDSRKYTLDRFALVKEMNDDVHGSFGDYWYYFFDISRYHTNKTVFEHYDNASKDIERGYGFLAHNGGAVFSPEKAVTDDGSVMPLEEREQEYLDKLLATAKEIDAEVIFYCAPVYYIKAEHLGRKNYLKTCIEKEGLTFADFSGDVEKAGIDYTTDLWSRDHFDSLGAIKTTRFLCEYLKSNYDIPDRRNDERYAAMNRDYIEWEELKAEYEAIDLGE
ncbi:MAG: hypothetical protein K6F56_06825 [Oscillospiraceae bacterium]|nr:hypothetical protein [Oscillospiraceae bacterium]